MYEQPNRRWAWWPAGGFLRASDYWALHWALRREIDESLAEIPERPHPKGAE